jgi:hypothetical protein
MRERAASLSATAEQLRSMVGRFRLGDEAPAESTDRCRVLPSMNDRGVSVLPERAAAADAAYGEPPLLNRRKAAPAGASVGVTPRRRASDWQRQSS